MDRMTFKSYQTLLPEQHFISLSHPFFSQITVRPKLWAMLGLLLDWTKSFNSLIYSFNNFSVNFEESWFSFFLVCDSIRQFFLKWLILNQGNVYLFKSLFLLNNRKKIQRYRFKNDIKWTQQMFTYYPTFRPCSTAESLTFQVWILTH